MLTQALLNYLFLNLKYINKEKNLEYQLKKQVQTCIMKW